MKIESALRAKARPNDPGFWREIWQQARLVVYLLRDREVPFYLKLLPFAAGLYILFPFDLIADFIPVLGQLDDITALLVSSKVFIELAPPAIVARHMASIRQRDGYGPLDQDPTAEADLKNAIIIETDHEVNKKDRA